jgi:transposase
MTEKRERLSDPEKIVIVERHLVQRVPVSDLCYEYGLQPSQILCWQAAILEHGAAVFDLKKGRHAMAVEPAEDTRIAKLEEAVAQKDAKPAQKNEVISELMEENILAKKPVGSPERPLGSPDTRDEVIDYVGKWTVRAELPAKRLLGWIGLPTSKYHLWRQHYGRPHAHNARIPRCPPQAAANQQRARMTQQRDQTPNPCCHPVPQRSIPAKTRLGGPQRDQRRLGNRTILPQHES